MHRAPSASRRRTVSLDSAIAAGSRFGARYYSASWKCESASSAMSSIPCRKVSAAPFQSPKTSNCKPLLSASGSLPCRSRAGSVSVGAWSSAKAPHGAMAAPAIKPATASASVRIRREWYRLLILNHHSSMMGPADLRAAAADLPGDSGGDIPTVQDMETRGLVAPAALALERYDRIFRGIGNAVALLCRVRMRAGRRLDLKTTRVGTGIARSAYPTAIW